MLTYACYPTPFWLKLGNQLELGLRDWNFCPFVTMSASSNHNRRVVDVLQTLGVSEAAIAWWQSQGLETCSDLQVVAEHLLPQCDTFVVFWLQMRRKPVTVIAQIVEVMREFNLRWSPEKEPSSLQQAKRGVPPAVL